MTLSLTMAALLFAGGAAAGWVDSIAGGGGLITIPLLLWVGLPPGLALGTNKFQSSFGSFTAARHYTREGVVSVRDAVLCLVGYGVGKELLKAVLGTRRS